MTSRSSRPHERGSGPVKSFGCRKTTTPCRWADCFALPWKCWPAGCRGAFSHLPGRTAGVALGLLAHLRLRPPRDGPSVLRRLLVVILFAVTSVYRQAVWWFAASFAILSLDTMLLGCSPSSVGGRPAVGFYLDLAVLASLLAPGWFAPGILARPSLRLIRRPPHPNPLPLRGRGRKSLTLSSFRGEGRVRGESLHAPLDALAFGRHRSVLGHQPAVRQGKPFCTPATMKDNPPSRRSSL